MGRIQLDDRPLDAMQKMTDGNPGAAVVLGELFQKTKEIDPHAGLGGYHYILFLDDMEIYGSKIWLLYKDICEQKVERIILLLRAWQLGVIKSNAITDAVNAANTPQRTKTEFKWEEILKKVKETVPEFAAVA